MPCRRSPPTWSRSYFNWKAWPNFTDRGKAPQLKKYALEELKPGVATPLKRHRHDRDRLSAEPWRRRIDGLPAGERRRDILCFGDTGPDAVEKGTRLRDVWTAVAGRVKQKRLKAIVIELSYASDRPDKLLFGHLTPLAGCWRSCASSTRWPAARRSRTCRWW